LDNGYDGGVDGEAYSSIFFQNANHSVRVTDEFMQAVLNDGNWTTHAIVTGEPVETYKAPELMRMIAESAYICGDQGMQYEKNIELNSCDYRALGLGYANLGALLMSQGIAYDSDYGRDYAAAISAIMTGEAYLQSAKISGELGPCAGFDVNSKPFLDVMRMHR